MRGFLLVLFYLVSIQLAVSQSEAANWVFGNNAWLEFTPSGPVSRNGARLNLFESSAAFSENGRLLFYTGSQGIADSFHRPLGGPQGQTTNSSSQGCVLFKVVGLDSTWFWATAMETECLERGNCQSGVIISSITKRQNRYYFDDSLVVPITTESIAVINHANKRDIWVVGHKFFSDQFFSILVSPTGIDTVVYSSIGPIIRPLTTIPPSRDSLYTSGGCLKISPNGRYLAHNVRKQSMGLFEFNNSTGAVINNFYSDFQPYVFPSFVASNYRYGVEFDSKSSMVYANAWNTDTLRQYKIAKGAILVEKIPIPISSCSNQRLLSYGALQLGIDGSIYIAQDGCSYLSRIKFPSLGGVACLAQRNVVSIIGGNSWLGLPSFNSSIFHKPQFRYSPRCLGDSTVLTYIGNDTNLVQLRWKFMDSVEVVRDTAIGLTVGWRYRKAGSYWVKLYRLFANGSRDTLEEQVYISTPVRPNFLGKDTTLCYGASYLIKGPRGTDAGVCRWQDGSVKQNFLATQPGQYVCRVENLDCITLDTITVNWYLQAPIYANIDTILCGSENLTVDLSCPNCNSYRWADNSSITSPVRTITQTRRYTLTYQYRNCTTLTRQVNFQRFPIPNLDLGPDQIFCEDQIQASLDATTNVQNYAYEWSDGVTGSTRFVSEIGEYSVRVYRGPCEARDTVIIRQEPCFGVVPNVITPNGDAKNQTFFIENLKGDWTLEIYNRWGQPVCETSAYRNDWKADGLPVGVYFYQLSRTGFSSVKGWVSVER